MLSTLAIPIQLMCQLINPGNLNVGNTTLAVDISSPQQTAVIPDGYTAFPDIGMAYKYYNYSREWNSARKDCTAHGANLAVADSFAKVNYIMGLKGEDDVGVYIGIHRLWDDIEWVSVKTASAPASIPWAPDAGEGTEEEKCLALMEDGSGSAPVKCSALYPFVCEIEIPILQLKLAETLVAN